MNLAGIWFLKRSALVVDMAWLAMSSNGVLLVNAASCHSGGGRAILNAFCSARNPTFERVLIISPIKPEPLQSNMEWICVDKSGVGAFIFSVFGVRKYIREYSPATFLSFTNLVPFQTKVKTILYFQNLDVIHGSSLRCRVTRFMLRIGLRYTCRVIFQSLFSSQEFEAFFGKVVPHKVCWPGVPLPPRGSVDDQVRDLDVLVPITDIYQLHKNFDRVLDVANKYSEMKFFVTATVPNKMVFADNVVFLGAQSRQEFLTLCRRAKHVLITSEYETVGLPIFEGIALGAKVAVLDRPYIRSHLNQFNGLTGLLVYAEPGELASFWNADEAVATIACNSNASFMYSDWNFYD